MRTIVIIAITILLAPSPSNAQSVSTAAASIGYSQPPSDKPSMNLSLMVGTHGNWLGLQLWGDLLLSEDTESVYYQDGSVCRNSDNGQFAESYKCGPAMDGALRGEAAIWIPGSGLSFGPGFRIAEDRSQPYGYIQYETGQSTGSFFLIRGLGGRNLIQLEVGLGFSWARKEEGIEPH